MTLLSVSKLGKSFRSYKNEWVRMARWFGLPFKPINEDWVLRNVNFEITAGQAVGIIGQNGAGKSTLLKLITGTLQPSEGSIEVKGRVAAILELGMGFNPEFTGRQNAIHVAGLLGFNSDEVHRVMPAIEEFAEVGEYFDQPVRTYSSGMQVRVAFAVATAYRPEILIIDEALSVGDVYFQHKSFARIREFQEQGTTLLIVSHDRNAIQGLCQRTILLEKGEVLKDGNPEEVFDFYNALIATKENSDIEVKSVGGGKVQTSSGTGEAQVVDIGLYNCNGEFVEQVAVGEQLEIRVKVKVFKPIDSLVLGYGIKDRLGQVIYGTNTWHTKQVISSPAAGDEFVFSIQFLANFGVGSYSIQIALVDRDTHLTANYEWRDLALVFSVINIDKNHFVGCLWHEPKICVEEVN
ncbi:ABC transporter ATP-binding protein [Microbulbifer sp. ZKSA004]|uniref:ABC transporter ATP-binding protein n=1 Tax=Microbulbifer sp. ZKSA004 TaxID=3243389 RepID=UPI004039C53A